MRAEQCQVPLCKPTIEDDEIAAVVEVLQSGWLASGPRTAQFEQAFRHQVGAAHALAVDSGTAGLHLALAALGVGPGDEVITPSLTWPATANAAELLGARAVFADVLPGTLLLDPADVERRITGRTKAVIPVHYAGAPADLAALRALAAQHGVALVHDAAHALGTWFGPEQIGSGPEPVVFSFHPIKNITTAEGGMVVVADDELAERIRLLRFHGITKDSWARHRGRGSARYEVLQPGWKYTMSDLHAALGLVQLGKLGRFNARRAQLADGYRKLLEGVETLDLPQVPTYPHIHAWHLFPVRLRPGHLAVDRDGFLQALADLGIGAGLHFTPLHQHQYYRRRAGTPASLPVTEAAGETVLSLPLYPGMSDADLERVTDTVRTLADRFRAPAGLGSRA